ncbi:hypothetical protein AVEN_27431-1 [Araneus ventricosus]|uniref:Uncharacterized protein n=1 Tax=Araneus ventricosus TaxID=182803 RepID=A0A4Y2EFX6_ARAVE|nr:hypothetical protein AVEN_27431-1 [Araneus ventricosus]
MYYFKFSDELIFFNAFLKINSTSDLSILGGVHLLSDPPAPKACVKYDFLRLPTIHWKISRRPRKKLPSWNLTGTPVKNVLLIKKKVKDEQEDKRKQQPLKKTKIRKTKRNKPTKNQAKKNKLARRQLDFQYSESLESTHLFKVLYVYTDGDVVSEDLCN